jgi:Flp pilus assembly pilin Flp
MADAINAIAARLQNAVADLRNRAAAPQDGEEGQEGQGLVEYVLLIALIALTLLAAILFFSGQLGEVFSGIGNLVKDNLPPD